MTNDTIYLYDDNMGRVQYVQHVGNDKMVVNAARVSFGQDNQKELDDRDRKLIRYLIKHRHTSTLEHCSITFKFVVPLYIRSQHHRHRTWSYNEISRRYTDENLQFYQPKAFRTQHKSNRQASNSEELINPDVGDYLYNDGFMFKCTPCEDEDMYWLVDAYHKMSLDIYNMMLTKGVCREQARGVLPQNLYTEYYGTVNLNNLFKFVELRTHDGAQWEIQQVAKACLKMAEDLFPETIKAYNEIRNSHD
jgi:thymidylate synthase (FAD)